MNLSKKFANDLVQEVGRETKLLRNTHRFAGFAVLKSPVVPSILFEIGYLSNRQEERLMRSGEHRTKIVQSIIRAIRSEEHTSELQSLMRISYAVFCLKKKKKQQNKIRI